MSTSHRLWRSAVSSCTSLALIGTVVAPRAAWAEPPRAPAATPSPALPVTAPGGHANLAESLTGDARQDYQAARILYEDGDYSGSLQKLKSAYEQSKDARLLWNMAACEKNLRHYAQVERLAMQYLAEGAALASASEQEDARALIDTVKGFVVELSVESNEAGASVLFDDRSIGVTPLPAAVRVDMGTHKITVKKEGFADFNVERDLPGGHPYHLIATLTAEHHEGKLRVVAGVSEAIQVDGREAGTGLWEATLHSGTHAVYVSAKGKIGHQAEVVVNDGTLTTLHVTLEDEPVGGALTAKDSGIPTWVWVAGSAVLVGGTIGAFFLLKPDSNPRYDATTRGSWGEWNL